MEATLEVRLLHRTTRRVSLTEDGQTVFAWAQRILEDFEQMSEAVSSSKTTPRGLLRISTSTGYGRKRVAPLLSELALHYPFLRIHLELLDRPVDMLGEGFDLDVRIGGVREPNLIVNALPCITAFCAPLQPIWSDTEGRGSSRISANIGVSSTGSGTSLSESGGYKVPGAFKP